MLYNTPNSVKSTTMGMIPINIITSYKKSKTVFSYTVFGVPHYTAIGKSYMQTNVLFTDRGLDDFLKNGLNQDLIDSMKSKWIKQMNSKHKKHPQRKRILYLIEKCHKRLSEKLERQATEAAATCLSDDTTTDDELTLSNGTQQHHSRRTLPITSKKNQTNQAIKKNNSKGTSSTASKKGSSKKAPNTSKKKETSSKIPKKASTKNVKHSLPKKKKVTKKTDTMIEVPKHPALTGGGRRPLD